MRITFVCPAFDLSGGQRSIATYADRLGRRGHRVAVVAPPHARPSVRDIARSLRRFRWPAGTSQPSHFDGLNVERRVLNRVRPVTAADVPDADVVVATWWETAEWVNALPPEKGRKVHFMQDYETWGGFRDRVDAVCRLPIPKIIIARWVGQLLADRFDIHDAALVPPSVDTAMFHAAPRDRQNRPTVGLVYTQFRNKGTDLSLAAVALARKVLPDIRLVAFGGNRPTAALPFPKNGEFHYRVANGQLKDIYSSCDAWLFGTRIEGYGLPILEAMACRTPVIGTPAGAAPELIGGGGGYLVRHEDPEDMAAAIVRLCRLPADEWRALSDAAFATANRYSWDDSTDLFERALAAAANAPSADPVAR